MRRKEEKYGGAKTSRMSRHPKYHWMFADSAMYEDGSDHLQSRPSKVCDSVNSEVIRVRPIRKVGNLFSIIRGGI